MENPRRHSDRGRCFVGTKILTIFTMLLPLHPAYINDVTEIQPAHRAGADRTINTQKTVGFLHS